MTVLAPGVPATEATLHIDGPPVGKGRPRLSTRGGKPRTHTPAATIRAENRVQLAWIEAGRPRLPDGALTITATVVVARPQAHWRKNGTLTTAGQRTPWPCRTPDLDNVLKLIADALNQHAYRDDAQIVDAHITRRWAQADEFEHITVRIATAPVPTVEAAA